jgi:hypothetical protein
LSNESPLGAVSGSDFSGLGPSEYDIMVSSLATNQARTIIQGAGGQATDPQASIRLAIHGWLGSLSKEKRRKLRLPTGSVLNFTPLIFSSGGLMDKDTEHVITNLKHAMTPGAYGFMLARLSSTLARSRGNGFK